MYKFYINDTLLRDEPIGSDAFVEVLERDSTVRGILLKYPSRLTFWGDGYDILESIYNQNGYCSSINLTIEQANDKGVFIQWFSGLILLSDAKDNLNKRTLDCAIEDNNFGAMIFNNKTQKGIVSVGFSKNGAAITPCTPVNIEVFNPTTGTYNADAIVCYKLKDVFKFLVSFMTDGRVGFASDWLDNTPDAEFTAIANGASVRVPLQGDTDLDYKLDICFDDLFQEINKKFNIGFVMEKDTSGNIIMRIEPTSYFYNQSPVVTISNIQDLVRSVDQTLLYSIIKIGSNNATYDAAIHSLPPVNFIGFYSEQYNVQGECNIDQTLDLTSVFVIDTNILEELTTSNISNTNYDTDIVLLQYTASTNKATQCFYFESSKYLYNGILTNDKVAPRWSVQGDIAKYLGIGDDTCSADRTANDFDIVLTVPAGVIGDMQVQSYSDLNTLYYNDEISDPNNRFTGDSHGSYIYTSSANGVYSFNLKTLTALYYFHGHINVTRLVQVDHYDNMGSWIETLDNGIEYLIRAQALGSGSDYVNEIRDYNFSIYLPTGHSIRTKYTVFLTNISGSGAFFSGDVKVSQGGGSTFKCIRANNGGGIYQVADLGSYFASKFEFKKGIPQSTWDAILSNPSLAIFINTDGNTNKKAWISKIQRTKTTSEGQFELVTNLDNGN